MSDFSKMSRGWCSPERYVQGPGEFDNLKFYNTANIDRCFVCYLQLLSHHKNIKPNNPQVKALFGKESCQRS